MITGEGFILRPFRHTDKKSLAKHANNKHGTPDQSSHDCCMVFINRSRGIYNRTDNKLKKNS
jgi:hypothetical protein